MARRSNPSSLQRPQASGWPVLGRAPLQAGAPRALCRRAASQERRMTTRTAIARIAKTIGRELEADTGPSESGWASGSMLAEAGATKDIAACLLAEARRKRPDDRLVNGCAFLLERALDALRLRRNGGDVGAGRAIGEVRNAI